MPRSSPKKVKSYLVLASHHDQVEAHEIDYYEAQYYWDKSRKYHSENPVYLHIARFKAFLAARSGGQIPKDSLEWDVDTGNFPVPKSRMTPSAVAPVRPAAVAPVSPVSGSGMAASRGPTWQYQAGSAGHWFDYGDDCQGTIEKYYQEYYCGAGHKRVAVQANDKKLGPIEISLDFEKNTQMRVGGHRTNNVRRLS